MMAIVAGATYPRSRRRAYTRPADQPHWTPHRMDTSANLGLPYIMAAQAQKHVTHNEAIRALDAVVQLMVLDRDLTDPPVSPGDGDRYLVAVGASGDWTGQTGAIAAFQDGAWAFYAPAEGWIAWVADEDKALAFDGTDWVELTISVNPTPLVGVNATADATNRLAVSSQATLLNHAGSGHQLKINKNTAADTASSLYQTGFSGRAEMGLAGDDDFHFKVSADGTTWYEAIVIDRASGSVSLPATVPAPAPFNLLQDAGRFGGSPEPKSAGAPTFTAPSYITSVNGAVLAQGPKFIYDNTTYGGSAGALDADVDALISKLKDASKRRYGVEFYLLQVTAGTGTSVQISFGGDTYYLPVSFPQVALPTAMSVNYHLLVKSGSVGIYRPTGIHRLFLDGTEYATHQKIVPGDGWRQVSKLVIVPPDQFIGYDNVVHGIYATPESVFYVAALTVVPGHMPIAPGLYYGVVPSLEAWR